MSIHKLFAVVVALAVLFAPAVSRAAMAATADHQATMMEAGHCKAPPSKSDDHDKMTGKSCCITMCMAIAIEPPASAETAEPPQQMVQFVPPNAFHGLLAEIATPPPRPA